MGILWTKIIVILSSDMLWSLTSLPSTPRLKSLLESFIKSSEPHTISHLYQSLICSHLEYACSVRHPLLMKDIKRIEGVQKFGLKVCLKQWQCGYEELLQPINLPILAKKMFKALSLYSMVKLTYYSSKPSHCL